MNQSKSYVKIAVRKHSRDINFSFKFSEKSRDSVSEWILTKGQNPSKWLLPTERGTIISTKKQQIQMICPGTQ